MQHHSAPAPLTDTLPASRPPSPAPSSNRSDHSPGPHDQQQHAHDHAHPQQQPQPALHWRDSPAYHHAPDLSLYLEATFVPSVVPQPEEYHAKEQARKYLEKLAAQVSPGAKLLPFGSMANGFALKNSDMDLCCFLAKDAPVRAPSELVELLGRLIEQETNFYVKMLPRARIPIIKLTMPPTPACPAGVACDIGFENRLALENTRLLLTYAMVDSRLRTLVLFLKVWTKRRKINNPYRGTLSSYGYVLLVIHFLAHVKQPPVLPNLQRLPLSSPSALEELTHDGHDISFFDDVDALPSVFQTANTDSAGELLIDFFRYWSKDFNFAHQVVSIRSEKGTVPKVQKGWHTDFEFDPEVIVRDQHKLCIEDPFQLDYNVARTVTRDGLYTIRGEFMRAYRILTTPPRSATPTAAEENIGTLIASLCEEREDYLLLHPADADLLPGYAQQGYSHHGGAAAGGGGGGAAAVGPKSPRRRSAPSPRLAPQPPHAHAHAQGAYAQVQPPLWAAANGAAVHLSRAGGGDAAGKGKGRGKAEEGAPDPGEKLGEPFVPTAAGAGATAMDRRSSWDGHAQAGAGAPGAGVAAGAGGVDLHRFFQGSQTAGTTGAGAAVGSSSQSDAGRDAHQPHPQQAYPSHGQHPHHGAAAGMPVSLTAPSSPDMAASSAYFAGHPAALPAYGYSRGYARPYGHVGPRLQSLPRHPHPAAAYPNPYAAPPTPLPFSPSLSPALVPARTAAPKPIFPAEDREAIALSSHIAFGSFPEMLPLPLPSYAHYHASGGSAAYLARAGGWGPSPYGVVPTVGRAAATGAGAGAGAGTGAGGRGARRDAPLGSTHEGEADADADDDAEDAGEELLRVAGGRGRSESDASRARRLRGRSAPHIRTGPDGRETLLFGAIEVTLPRAEDVEEAEREVDGAEGEGAEEEDAEVEEGEVRREMERVQALGEGSAGSASDNDDDDNDEDEEQDARDPAPSPPSDPSSPAAPPTAPPIPTLTTQPPTPAKPAARLASPPTADEEDEEDEGVSPQPNGHEHTRALALTNGFGALHLDEAAPDAFEEEPNAEVAHVPQPTSEA